MLILCVAILFAYLLILKHEGGILFYLYLTGVLGGLTASILFVCRPNRTSTMYTLKNYVQPPEIRII